VDVTPWETASGGKGVVCKDRAACSISFTWQRPDGWYDIAVQYFDFRSGASQYTLQVAGHAVDSWAADAALPDNRMNGNTSTRRTLRNVALHRGDTLLLTGKPDGLEPAPVDYFEVTPAAATTHDSAHEDRGN
jgi:alpha-glucuronidase